MYTASDLFSFTFKIKSVENEYITLLKIEQCYKYKVATPQCEGMVEVVAARYEETISTPSLSIRHFKILALKGLNENISLVHSDSSQLLLPP